MTGKDHWLSSEGIWTSLLAGSEEVYLKIEVEKNTGSL